MPLYPVKFSRDITTTEEVTRWIDADSAQQALELSGLAHAAAASFNEDCPDDVTGDDAAICGGWSFTILTGSPALTAAIPSDLILSAKGDA